MAFKLEFETDNDVFHRGPIAETKRILAEVANKVAAGNSDGPVLDRNGNRIGAWSVEFPEAGS